MYSLYISTWYFPENDDPCYEKIDHRNDYDKLKDALMELIYWLKLHQEAYPETVCSEGIIELVTPIENGRQQCAYIMEDDDNEADRN